MSRSIRRPFVVSAAMFVSAIAVSLMDGAVSRVEAGGIGGFGVRQVGGVYIGADGFLKNMEVDGRNELRQIRTSMLQQVPGDLNQPTELRKISLRRLEAALADAAQNGKQVTDDIRYLAGLQNIRYVIAVPEQNDIILVGFGEGWTIDKQGNMVGKTTGWPVMMVDHLLVALRSARESANGGIYCSIDPTQEGMQKLRQIVPSLGSLGNMDTIKRSVEDALGPQQIKIGGVPGTSHFARVLVAADYRMKRIGMALEKSPVPGLASYLAMISGGGGGMQSMTPRWWMVPSYDALLTDAERLTFELRGSSVKTMTEETFFDEQGVAKAQKGKASPAAQRWADQMTKNYRELAIKEPIFGELRNCMDLAIVAALILKENLPQKTGYQFSLLVDAARLPNYEFPVPKQVGTQVSIVPKASSYVISASGGVQIEPWKVIEKPETTTSLSPVRAAATPAKEPKAWWWN